MSESSRKTVLYLFPTIVIVAAGIASFGAQRYVFPAEASPSEWKPAAEWAQSRIGSNDVIRTHPPWNIDALPHLEARGDQISRHEFPVLGDLYEADDVWVFSEANRVNGAVERLPFEPKQPARKRLGDVTVVRATVPGELKYEWEALDHLDEARIRRVPAKKSDDPRTCENWSESDRRWDCGSRDRWLYVGEAYKILGHDARDAIWAHPLPGGKHLEVTFSEVPLGELLRIRAGFTFMSSRKDRGKPVTMEVHLNGEIVARNTYPILESEWEAIDVDTSSYKAEKGRLTVEIWSDGFRDRYFCFNAWAR